MENNNPIRDIANEFEILEFTLNENHYGIDVSKIREILIHQPVTPVPNAGYCIEGIFMPRGDVITVISLKKSLSIPDDDSDKGLFIITCINNTDMAFHVDAVVGIHRVSRSDIIEPDATINVDENGVTTGVIKMEDKLVVILNFEKIAVKISPELGEVTE